MSDCKIVVGCRIRPLNEQEINLGNEAVLLCKDESSISVLQNGEKPSTTKGEFKFDFTFGQEHDNNSVYEKLGQPIIAGVLDGFHGTVFAYGQTSSGKTHTLLGVPEEMGIIVHAVHDIFDHIHHSPEEMEFLIRVSYLEIYNEEVKDLLASETNSMPRSLKIVDDPHAGCVVQGLKEVVVLSPDHVFELLKSGEERRHYGATKMNYTSSRSHTVFRLVVESRVDTSLFQSSREAAASTSLANDEMHEEKKSSDGQSISDDEDLLSVGASSILSSNRKANGDQVVQTATLNLVDLAGSERVSKTEVTGARLKEGSFINKSLLVLGTVINKLADGKKGHIPFRDSKLTRLLKNSLGGNAKTSIICTLSPAQRNLEESKSTLQFASRAKTIVNKASKNHLNNNSALLDEYRQEIAELKIKLAMGGSVIDMPELSTIRQQLKEEESKRLELQVHLEKEKDGHQQRKKEVEDMRKLVLLTSKMAANPTLAGKMQEHVRCLVDGEKELHSVIQEVEELAATAADDEEEEEDEDNSSVFPTFSSVSDRIQLALRSNRGESHRRRRLSTLAMGIVASMAEQRKAEEKVEADELWRLHLNEKIEGLQRENDDLRSSLHDFHRESLSRKLSESSQAELRQSEEEEEVKRVRERLEEALKDLSIMSSNLESSNLRVQFLEAEVEAMKRSETSLLERLEQLKLESSTKAQASDAKAKEFVLQLQKSTIKLQELTEAVFTKNTRLEALERERDETAERLQSKESEAQKAKDTLSSLEISLNENAMTFARELQKQNDAVAKLSKENKELEKMNLEITQKQEKELEQLLNRFETQQTQSKSLISEQEVQISELRAKVNEYENQISQIRADSDGISKVQKLELEHLQSELLGKQSIEREFLEKTQSLSLQLAQAENENAELHRKLEKSTEDLKEYETERISRDHSDSLEKLNRELIESVSTSKIRIEELERERMHLIDQLHRKSLDSEEKISEKSAALDELQEQLDLIQADLMNTKRDKTDLVVKLEASMRVSKDIGLARERVQTLEKSNEELVQNLNLSKLKVRELETKQDTLSKLVRDHELEAERLENRLKGSKLRSSVLITKIGSGFESSCDTFMKRVQPSIKKLEVLSSRILPVQRQVATISKRIPLKKYSTMFETNLIREKCLVQELAEVKEQLCEVESKLVQSQREKHLEEMEQVVLRFEDEQNLLVKELESERELSGRLSETLDCLREELSIIKESSESLQRQLFSKSNELSSVRAAFQKLRLDVEERICEMQNSLEVERTNSAKLRQEASSVKERARRYEAEVNRARADAALATETFLEYQDMSKRREEHFRRVIERQDDRVAMFDLKPQTLEEEIQSLRSRVKSDFQRQKRPLSMSSDKAHQAGFKDGQVTEKFVNESTLLSELERTRKELDVFRRLDVYSASLKRALNPSQRRDIQEQQQSRFGPNSRVERLLRIQSNEE